MYTCTICKEDYHDRPTFVGVAYPEIRMITIAEGGYNAPGLQNREMKLKFQPLQICSDACMMVAAEKVIRLGVEV